MDKIAQILIRINRQLLYLMVCEAARKKSTAIDVIVAEDELAKYLEGDSKIPMNVLFHYAELAGKKEDFSWYINRFNYSFNVHQSKSSKLLRFLEKVESRINWHIKA